MNKFIRRQGVKIAGVAAVLVIALLIFCYMDSKDESRRQEIDLRGWMEAIASVRDSPEYRGLELEVIEDLLPIGRDPSSGLWEFVHLRTGAVPERDKNQELRITDETGLDDQE